MKILIEGGDLNPPFVEGTRNIAKTHWEELKGRGHEIVILTRRKETNTGKVFHRFEVSNGIKYYRWGNYFELFSALVKIKKEKVDAVHVFAKALRPVAYLSILKRLINRPIIFSLLGYPFHQSYSEKDFPKFLKKVDFLLVSSKTIFNELNKKYRCNNMSHVPYGISTKKFSSKRKKAEVIRIVCLKKPGLEVVNAFEKISKERENLILILDKKLATEENLDKLSNKKIKYINFLPDISKLLNTSDILIEIHPKQEFLDCASPPLLLLEAMASEMAIISTNIPEITEIMKNKKEGLLISSNNRKNIYRAIKRTLLERKKYSNNSRKRILEKYDIVKICDFYEKKVYVSANRNGPKLQFH